MRQFRLKIHLLSLESKDLAAKTKKTFEGSLPRIILAMSSYLVKDVMREWEWTKKEFWKITLKEKILARRLMNVPHMRIVVLLIFNMVAFSWLVNQKIIVVNFPLNYAKSEESSDMIFENKPLIENPNPKLHSMIRSDDKEVEGRDSDEKEFRNIKDLNKVVMDQDEMCQVNKTKEKCNELCVKNEEEILEKWQKEERERLAKIRSAQPARRVINAPVPYVYAKVDGRRVCNRKNDHPKKSKNNEPGHMDMECCLDPDEIPNPHCHYSVEKYGKYL